ncbi:flagellar hook-basal body complex protein FliE [Paenibacillus sp. R14(2021)]|uniref:flagellar hook-basal body complex protein FliE n=1 Tax=Paenibacillus sp. R14(2021) TaxID=2859228 RepID=UPI00280C38CF|nr:flagellar hook-basal body complex protein FliE [Paenibacillus sp. R14(2021)]
MINPMSFSAAAPSQSIKPIVSNSLKDQTTPSQMTQTFSDFLKNAIDGVSDQEKNVHTMNDQYLLGNVDVSQVMVATQQAELGLQLTSQIRNKVVEAYQEIMRMQI